MIDGPKNDDLCRRLQDCGPRGAGDQRASRGDRVLKRFQERMPYGLFVPDAR
jgi:hypothetical protein